MSAFEKALAMVLEDEAGYSNHALDRGGPTNLGITLKTWERYHGRKGSVSDIRMLRPDTVAPIYKALFWDTLQLDQFPELLALVIFNQGVLRGTPAAAKTLQAALRIAVDGVIGPETIAAVKAANQRRVIFDFLRISHDSYLRILYQAPDQAAFIRGWSNRVFRLLEYAAFNN